MACDQRKGAGPRRQLRQRGDAQGDAEAQRQRTIGADPAVLHDRKPRSMRPAAAKGIGGVGKAILVQRAGHSASAQPPAAAATNGPQIRPASSSTTAETAPMPIPTAGKYFSDRASQSGCGAVVRRR